MERTDGGWERKTVHFTANHAVVPNLDANWDDMEVTVIIPLYKIPKSRIENFNPIDTWVRGNLGMPEGTIVIGNESSPKVDLGKATYEVAPQDSISIEKFILKFRLYGYGRWLEWMVTSRSMASTHFSEFAKKEGLYLK